MKIVHINFSQTWRGGERQVFLLMQGLKKQNIDQVLICKKGGELQARCREAGFENYAFPGNPFALSAASKFVKKLNNSGYNIVHCHESKGQTIGVLSKLLWGSRQEIILHRRVIFPIKRKLTTGIKYSENYIARIICISGAVEAVVKKSIGFKKTVVIPSMVPVKAPVSSAHKLSDQFGLRSNKIVGYIAALTHEKDHYTFLRTAKEILESGETNVDFVIIGEGKLKEKLIRFSEELKLQEHVTFTGFLDNIEQVISEIDILLFTSVSEGLGTTILDFFVAKKPVVSVKNGGSEEIIIDGETGFLCEKGDVSALSSKVQLLLNNPQKSREITEKAYDFVKSNFSIDHITERTIQVYKNVVNQN